MINIRPVSDLRNKFTELESVISTSNSPIFLTKNGYGKMVLMSIEQYSNLTENIENKLDEADLYAQNTSARHNKEEVFSRVRKRIDEAEKI